MWNKYKFNHNEDCKLFLTSDTHWGHNKEFIYQKRGFKSIEEHDETLIQRWNETVRPEDHVIHLGDFVVGAGKDSEKIVRKILSRLNGKISLILGNHCGGIGPIYKNLVKDIKEKYNIPFFDDKTEIFPLDYNERIRFLGYQCLAQVRTEKKTHFVFCSHFAHRIWIDNNKGVLAASAHSHSSDKESNPEWKYNKRLDVGIDNFGKPLDFDEFLSIMDSKEIQQVDHHDENISPSF